MRCACRRRPRPPSGILGASEARLRCSCRGNIIPAKLFQIYFSNLNLTLSPARTYGAAKAGKTMETQYLVANGRRDRDWSGARLLAAAAARRAGRDRRLRQFDLRQVDLPFNGTAASPPCSCRKAIASGRARRSPASIRAGWSRKSRKRGRRSRRSEPSSIGCIMAAGWRRSRKRAPR